LGLTIAEDELRLYQTEEQLDITVTCLKNIVHYNKMFDAIVLLVDCVVGYGCGYSSPMVVAGTSPGEANAHNAIHNTFTYNLLTYAIMRLTIIAPTDDLT